MDEEQNPMNQESIAAERPDRIFITAETNVPTLVENDGDGFTRIVVRTRTASDWMVMLHGGETIVDCARSGRKTVDAPDGLELRFYGAEEALAAASAFIRIGWDLARQSESNLLKLDCAFAPDPAAAPFPTPDSVPTAAPPVQTAPIAAPMVSTAVAPAAYFRPAGSLRIEALSRTRAGLKRAAMMLPVAAATAAVVHAGTVTGSAGGSVTASASGHPTHGGDDRALNSAAPTDFPVLTSSSCAPTGASEGAPVQRDGSVSPNASPGDGVQRPSTRPADVSGMQPVWLQERNRVWLTDTRDRSGGLQSPMKRLRSGLSRVLGVFRGVVRRG